ncbi:FAD-dependent monooxygenase [Flavobacterium sp. WLB]|uniref:FAD-dependent oxidoreductase n=1 Tax=unclassified Flavobacterium TaxID=196869 RepID=UPI0006AB8258|nr:MULTISPECIES: NAD(P)/FAD-dependent oxidoreductase [unclassified Flavobacterium]KOP36972.1 2-polyprenyl-6-methoxyphenol hydroxylase [Flavobacterium sp. VMW]OWU89745.1 2-polyprenyl-6-methoxyphenol hydroxylase [Flavobacterium sp. NLM]PUU68566.1 FAD-dependent monooxygenase [Flavobacterium sp. WLB]
MLLDNKKVAIIGGGPGGLTLARLLQEKGIDVKVYERDENRNVRQQGHTLDLHEDTGLKAIQEAGLMEEFKKYYRPGADKMRIADKDMTVVFDDQEEKPEDDFGNEHFRPEIDRGPLRDLLIASLKEENVIWNSKFTQMKPLGAGWEISFENGTTTYADFVIASDGANSRVRKYLTDIEPIFSGVTAVEINIYKAKENAPNLWKLVNDGKLFALEEGKTFFCSSKADGTLTILIGIKTEDNWVTNSGINFKDKNSVAEWFKNEFRTWNTDWQEIFETNEISIIPRPMYHFPIDQYWKPLPNLTIIGDAAHRIPPYAGEGANQAMADALDFYEIFCFGNYETIEEAVSLFENKMRSRMEEITEDTLKMTDAMHVESNLQFLTDFFNQVY